MINSKNTNKKNEKNHEGYIENNRKYPQILPSYFLGGVGLTSIKIITTLTQGPLMDSWLDIIDETNNHSII